MCYCLYLVSVTDRSHLLFLLYLPLHLCSSIGLTLNELENVKLFNSPQYVHYPILSKQGYLNINSNFNNNTSNVNSQHNSVYDNINDNSFLGSQNDIKNQSVNIRQLNRMKKNKVIFSHGNVNGIFKQFEGKNVSSLLDGYLVKNNVSFCSINEHNIKQGDPIPKFKLYNWYGSYRNTSRGGTGMLVHKYYDSDPTKSCEVILDTNTGKVECTFIQVTVKKKNYLLGSVYLPGHSNEEIEDMDNILKYLNGTDRWDEICIAGDFNAWNTSWGNNKNNDRGIKMMGVLVDNHYSFIPTDFPTRINPTVNRTDSFIDFFISNNSQSIKSICKGPKFSDHLMIEGVMDININSNKPRKKVFDFKNSIESGCIFEMDSYFENIDWLDFFINCTRDEVSIKMTDLINDVWNKFGVIKHVNDSSKPWFTPLIKNLCKVHRYWERKIKIMYKHGLSYFDFGGVNLSFNEVKETHSYSLQNYFDQLQTQKEHCDNYITDLLNKDLHKAIKKIFYNNKRTIPDLKVGKGNNTRRVSDDREKAEIFNKIFINNTQVSNRKLPQDPHISIKLKEVNSRLRTCQFKEDGSGYYRGSGGVNWKTHLNSLKYVIKLTEQADEKFKQCNPDYDGKCLNYPDNFNYMYSVYSTYEVNYLRRNLKPAVGRKGFNSSQIKYLNSKNFDLGFAVSINIQFQGEYWPKIGVNSDSFPHYKKGLPSDPNNYRSIGNNHSFPKFEEGLVDNRFRSFAESKKLFNPKQYGGIKGHSTVLQLIRVMELVNIELFKIDFDEKGREYQINQIILYLADIMKAFDSYCRINALYKLIQCGLEGPFLSRFATFFVNRTQTVTVGNQTSSPLRTLRGGPQGSNITLLSFLVVINDITDYISGDCALFVDDLCGWVSKQDHIIEDVEYDFNSLLKWSIQSQQTFHPKKFKLYQMKNNLTKIDLTKKEVHFGKKKLKWVTNKTDPIPSYIGVPWDMTLKFYELIKDRTSRVSNNMWRMRNHYKSLNGSTLKLMFYSYVFPHFLYGSPLWIFQAFKPLVPGAHPQKGYIGVFGELNKLYIECAKKIMGINLNVSSYAVLVRIGWLPLNYVLALQSITWIYRMRKIPDSEVYKLFTKLKEDRAWDYDWGNTKFLKPGYEMIIRLQNVYNTYFKTDKNFLESATVEVFKSLIETSSYLEFNNFWRQLKDGKHTRQLIPNIIGNNSNITNLLLERQTEIFYYKLSFYHNPLNSYLNKYGNADTNLCRFCNTEVEDVYHIFGECSCMDYRSLKMACVRKNVQFNVSELLTNPKVKINCEKFLKDYFF